MKNITNLTLPAEWYPQDGILLCWPHQSMDWESVLDAVDQSFAEMVCAISQHQKALIVYYDNAHKAHIEALLDKHPTRSDNLIWFEHQNNDTWCRDLGVITVLQNNQPVCLDFGFNGWGNKFEHTADNALNQQLATVFKCPVESQPMILEGGSIDSDGQGSLLTTTTCLLSKERNPLMSQQQIEDTLKQTLGVERIFWLEHGYLEGDDTDSHIDNLARFANETTIVYASCNDESDPQYQSLKLMEAELQQLRTADNRPYQLIPLSIPAAIYDDGDRVPASYVNFLITNQSILMPAYGDAMDTENKDKLQKLFPNRTIQSIDCRDIIKQSGALHCLTMQLPKGTLS